MSFEPASERPAKRPKVCDSDDPQRDGSVAVRVPNQKKPSQQAQKAPPQAIMNGSKPGRRQFVATSASGIHSGDVGIFVTSDKGQEKRCLQEMSDILEEYFGREVEGETTGMKVTTPPSSHARSEDIDIEADILSELSALREKTPRLANSASQSHKVSYITLDIPCVSFVRFPSKSTVDPIETVRQICLMASRKDSPGPRSRYIKRLTPVSLVRKTLNNGLDSLCDEILPRHFSVESEPALKTHDGGEDEPVEAAPNAKESPNLASTPVKFAIRPTIRNNNKIDRDQVIRVVADKIGVIGHGQHRVDLKGYDKLVLVDVYRNIVAMSVVGSEFESLKRFNLAEIQAMHFEHDDNDSGLGK